MFTLFRHLILEFTLFPSTVSLECMHQPTENLPLVLSSWQPTESMGFGWTRPQNGKETLSQEVGETITCVFKAQFLIRDLIFLVYRCLVFAVFWVISFSHFLQSSLSDVSLSVFLSLLNCVSVFFGCILYVCTHKNVHDLVRVMRTSSPLLQFWDSGIL